MSELEQLQKFVEWEREHNPDKTHVAEWALNRIRELEEARDNACNDSDMWQSKYTALWDAVEPFPEKWRKHNRRRLRYELNPAKHNHVDPTSVVYCADELEAALSGKLQSEQGEDT